MVHKLLNPNPDKKIETSIFSTNPVMYYTMVELIRSVTSDTVEGINLVAIHIDKEYNELRKVEYELRDVINSFNEVQSGTTKKNITLLQDSVDKEEENFEYNNYIILLYDMIRTIMSVYDDLSNLTHNIVPPNILTPDNRVLNGRTFEDINNLRSEMQFNGRAIEQYAEKLCILSGAKPATANIGNEIAKKLETFYRYLLNVHNNGVLIEQNAVVTNVAMQVFENIDASGEIDYKASDDRKLSAYTIRKAETLTQALTNPVVRIFIKQPDRLHYLLRIAITDWTCIITDLTKLMAGQLEAIRNMAILPDIYGNIDNTKVLHYIDSLKFSNIVYTENISGESNIAEEKRNETITEIVKMILDDKIDFKLIVEYVIDRKKILQKFYFDENSFYVCKIGDGNPFLGKAPGALYVEPALRPMGNMTDILGSGFDEIKLFFDSIEHASKFQDLFMATSPSKTADKSNVLMAGPQGCGKALPASESVLTPTGWKKMEDLCVGDHVIGSDGKSTEVIGVYPQGEREIVAIKFNDGSIVRCDWEHLWTIKSPHANAWHTVTTKQIFNATQYGKFYDTSYINIPSNKSKSTRKWFTGLYSDKGARRLYIPMLSAPVEFDSVELLIDPYVLGAWLGDGTSAGGVITGIDDEVFENVERRGFSRGFRNEESCGFNGLRIMLRDLGVLDNKHIPQKYLIGTVQQRLDLLRGLMDTDGNAGGIKTRRTTFSNSNEKLVDAIVTLVQSLGGIARKGKAKIPTYTYKGEKKKGKPSWQVGIKLPESLGSPFSITRKVSEYKAATKYAPNRLISSIEILGYKEEAICIKVAATDSLFVTSNCVLTHNTEVLRAVGADPNSIGVFAQGSDFLTCWKGEAEKNPKRMFLEGVRLSKESGKHVHFLIDEIDSLLNSDRDISGNNNLTMEFQILMDGVIRYPKLSVWGATNNITRIPMPMIRRFSKVAIVGELSRDDRSVLLTKFMSYMPMDGTIKQIDWENWASKLEGATGDVVRKIADHVWRTKMSDFVSKNEDKAEEIIRFLNAEGKFQISNFKGDDREKFKRELSKYVTITGTDIDSSIEYNLLNLGVRSEIETAVATYKAAKEYLDNAKMNLVQTCDA